MTFFEAVKMVNSLAMTAYTIADGNSELNNVEFIDSSSDILREDTCISASRRPCRVICPRSSSTPSLSSGR